jgi:hypothetical protein
MKSIFSSFTCFCGLKKHFIFFLFCFFLLRKKKKGKNGASRMWDAGAAQVPTARQRAAHNLEHLTEHLTSSHMLCGLQNQNYPNHLSTFFYIFDFLEKYKKPTRGPSCDAYRELDETPPALLLSFMSGSRSKQFSVLLFCVCV